MFDEDLFSVFNETTPKTEKPGSQTETGSSRNDDPKISYHEAEGNSEKNDNKRYEQIRVSLKHDGTDGPDGTGYTDGTSSLVADGTDYKDGTVIDGTAYPDPTAVHGADGTAFIQRGQLCSCVSVSHLYLSLTKYSSRANGTTSKVYTQM